MRVSGSVVVAGLLGALAAGACTEPEPPRGPFVTSRVERKVIPLSVRRDVDVLFVIDRSAAMAPFRDALRASFREMMTGLEALPDGLPDLHLGVVSADLGTDGPALAGCTATGDAGRLRTAAGLAGAFVSDTLQPDGTRARNYTGEFADVFAALADVGSEGCGFARPLEAARRALGDEPANAGFLRADAYLLIVVVSASDDCSFADATFFDGIAGDARTPALCASHADRLAALDSYAQQLKALKPDPSKVMLAAIIGPSAPADPTCNAAPATRLHGALERFPNRSTEVSICGPDHAAALELLAVPFKITLGIPCWEAQLADLDDAQPGIQPGCAAWYTTSPDHEYTLPACSEARPDHCYRMVEEPINCWFGSGLTTKLEPPLGSRFPPDTLVTLECLVAND